MRWNGGLPSKAWLTTALTIALVVSSAPMGLAQDPSSSPPPERIWTVHTSVEATVEDNYATVRVIAQIDNRGPDPEFPFEVRVPDDAFITNLTITRDGTTHVADIEEREQARERYEQAKQEERTAGLVEKHRSASVYAYKVNVEGFESVRAELTYERYLSANRSVYTLPLRAPVSGFGHDTGASFDVTIDHSDGVESVWATPNGRTHPAPNGTRLTYEVGPREPEDETTFDVHYTLEPTSRSGSLVTAVREDIGYFAHRLRTQTDAHQLPLDMVLVLDTSGSMRGEKIEQVKDAATQVIRTLDEEDRLHLTFFSSTARSPWTGLRSVGVNTTQDAVDAIEGLFAGGGTNLADGMRDGFPALDPAANASQERLSVIAFLTDGRAGSSNEELRSLAQDLNVGGANVFGLAFGGRADWGLIHGLAADGNGTALRVPVGQGAEVDIRRFLTALTTPVLKDVRIEYVGDVQAYHTTAPVLFAGSELLVLGTFDANRSTLDANISAVGPEGPRSWTVSEPIEDGDAGDWLPRLLAYQRIRELQDRIDAHGPDPAWVENVTRLGLEHGFVTDYTSLVLDLDHQPADLSAEEGPDDRDASDPSAGGGGSAGMSSSDGAGGPPASSRSTSAYGGADGASSPPASSSPPDTDGDGIADARDACPSQPGGAAYRGCAGTDDQQPDQQPDQRSPDTQDSQGPQGPPLMPGPQDLQNRSFDQGGQETPTVGLIGALAAIAVAAVGTFRRER